MLLLLLDISSNPDGILRTTSKVPLISSRNKKKKQVTQTLPPRIRAGHTEIDRKKNEVGLVWRL